MAHANRAIHKTLQGGWLDFLSALIEGRIQEAHIRWESYTQSLERHATFEDEHVLSLADSTEITIPAKADPRLIAHDHKLLRAAVSRVGDFLTRMEALPAAQRARYLAESWQIPARMAEVFEHHSVRENDILYPALDRALAAERRDRLAQALAQSAGVDP